MIDLSTWVRAAYLARACNLEWGYWATHRLEQDVGDLKGIEAPHSWQTAAHMLAKHCRSIMNDVPKILPAPSFNGDTDYETDPKLVCGVRWDAELLVVRVGALQARLEEQDEPHLHIAGHGTFDDVTRMSVLCEALHKANALLRRIQSHGRTQREGQR